MFPIFRTILLVFPRRQKLGKLLTLTRLVVEFSMSDSNSFSVWLPLFPCCRSLEQASIAELKEDVWHGRFGHLSVGSLKQLAADGLVDGFDFDRSKEISFCEPCVKGKHHRNPFPSCGGTRAAEPLGLVHTDVCRKINVRSIGGAEYFLTFVDDKTRYVWVYFLKPKEEVFSHFADWKAMVEKASGRKLKRVRSDNGWGIHLHTIQRIPENRRSYS